MHNKQGSSGQQKTVNERRLNEALITKILETIYRDHIADSDDTV